MNELLKKIEDAGIKVCDGQKDTTVTVYPFYRDNFGFFHICADKWESILVKGVYKDNIRQIKGEPEFESKKIN